MKWIFLDAGLLCADPRDMVGKEFLRFSMARVGERVKDCGIESLIFHVLARYKMWG